MSFAGRRVLALESRRAAETAELIRRNGGEPFVAPSMKEVPLESNEAAFRFAEQLFKGEFEMVIFLTGTGTRHLAKVIGSRYRPEQLPDTLRRITVAARGPKPVAVLREMSVPVAVVAPEPNTWRELITALEGRPERRIAVQEYGKTNPELIDALRARGAEVTQVPVYQYTMPDDTGPLREAAERLAKREFDVALFTTSQQLVHLLQIAEELQQENEVLDGLRSCFVASIGPTTTETLNEHGLRPAMEPSHPKLGILVREAAERWKETHAARQTARF